jgi:hypothetical protein
MQRPDLAGSMKGTTVGVKQLNGENFQSKTCKGAYEILALSLHIVDKTGYRQGTSQMIKGRFSAC